VGLHVLQRSMLFLFTIGEGDNWKDEVKERAMDLTSGLY